MPKFKKAQLQELLDGGSETLKVVSDKITGKGRWALSHELVFQDQSTHLFYRTHYSEGATEQQDESPFEYEGEEVECEEVRPVERVVTNYEAINIL